MSENYYSLLVTFSPVFLPMLGEQQCGQRSDVMRAAVTTYVQILKRLISFSVMESSEWPSVGIFSGMVNHFGNYDECLTVSMQGMKGQYCLAQAMYDYPGYSSTSELEEVPNEALSVWDAMLMVICVLIRKV